MHYFKIENSKPGVRSGRYFLNLNLPEHPLCYLLGHRPTVYRLVFGRPHADGAAEYRWVECKRCLRRSTRQVPPSPQPVSYDGIAQDVDRRSGWNGHTLELHAELYARKPKKTMLGNHPSFRLHVGGRGSETPFDAHLDLGVLAGYFGFGGTGVRLAEWLTRGKGRDLSCHVHGWALYWKLWTDEEHRCDKRRSGKYQPWRCRDGSITINLRDYLYGGPARYAYESIGEPRDGLLVMPEGEYVVGFQLQRQTLARPRGPRKSSCVAEWNSDAGIPIRNHEWKGDNVYASGVAIPAGLDDWLPAAVDGLRAQIERDRAHHEWRRPETVAPH
jgi:hypothetical protein